MLLDPKHWALFLMDFVDDFRYYKDPQAIAEPLPFTDPRLHLCLPRPQRVSAMNWALNRRAGWPMYPPAKHPGLSLAWKT